MTRVCADCAAGDRRRSVCPESPVHVRPPAPGAALWLWQRPSDCRGQRNQHGAASYRCCVCFGHFFVFFLPLLSSFLPSCLPFFVLPSFLPSVLLSFLLPSFPPSIHLSFLPSGLLSFFSSLLPSIHPSFLPSFPPSLPSFLPFVPCCFPFPCHWLLCSLNLFCVPTSRLTSLLWDGKSCQLCLLLDRSCLQVGLDYTAHHLISKFCGEKGQMFNCVWNSESRSQNEECETQSLKGNLTEKASQALLMGME